jgi:hypothetical protein
MEKAIAGRFASTGPGKTAEDEEEEDWKTISRH